MKAAMIFLLLSSITFGQTGAADKSPSAALRIELRTSSVQVRMSDEIVVSLFFRSPDKTTTIWNALFWAGSTGLELQVFDSSGHRLEHTVVPYEPMPPDLTGKDALISIEGDEFAGFDSQFAVSELFPRPGSYTIKCIYSPRLTRHYFKGHTIWGREDGRIESAPVSVFVE